MSRVWDEKLAEKQILGKAGRIPIFFSELFPQTSTKMEEFGEADIEAKPKWERRGKVGGGGHASWRQLPPALTIFPGAGPPTPRAPAKTPALLLRAPVTFPSVFPHLSGLPGFPLRARKRALRGKASPPLHRAEIAFFWCVLHQGVVVLYHPAVPVHENPMNRGWRPVFSAPIHETPADRGWRSSCSNSRPRSYAILWTAAAMAGIDFVESGAEC